MELRLAKVLRHVWEDSQINIDTLAAAVVRKQGITHDQAITYIWELIADNYLDYDSKANVTRGSAEYPAEITPGGYYTFLSNCWSCTKQYERQLDIYSVQINWECLDCQVKWRVDVMENDV